MSKPEPEWVNVLRALETFDGLAVDLTAWLGEDMTVDQVGRLLEEHMLGAHEVEGKAGRQCLLAIPARVNELAFTLGETYWSALAKAPPKVVVSKTATHRIGGMRHQVVMVDVGAWRAWDAEHRRPDRLGNEQLTAFVERIERLEEEKQTIADDIKEVYAETKGHGYDTKILRKVIGIRKLDAGEWDEQVSLIDLYLRNLGEMRPYDED